MKQKMSRASGVDCAAAAFMNWPGAELVLKFFKKVLAFFRQLDYTMQVLFLWLIGQAVKTSPSHGENRGAIPLSAAL